MLRAGLDTGYCLLPLRNRWGRQPRQTSIPIYAAAATAILLLTACSEKPLIVSADTSCEKFRHISATDEQIKVFADNWSVMEPYADQILTHNAVYDAACLREPK